MPTRTDLVAAMMCAVLGRSALAEDDSFFAAGGSSLLAARLVAAISSRLGVAATVQDVYEHPTAHALAEHLAGALPSPPPPRAVPRPEVVPLAPVQRRLWLHNRLRPDDATYNMATAVRIDGPLDDRAMRAAVADVVERHESLRTVHPDWEGVAEQVVLDPHEAEVEVREVLDGARDGLREVAADAAIGFDLTVDVPLRVLLVREGPDRHVLGLVIHHIACDGWSLAPLLADLARCYRHRTGDGPGPAPLPVQYADYALWSREQLEGSATVDRELAYWRRELLDPPPVPVLEGMRPRSGRPTHVGGEQRRRIPADLHRTVLRRAEDLGASAFMVVHAALLVVLHRMGAQEEVVVGTPVAGRPDPVLDDLVGFFVNTLALRVDAGGNPTFEELVARVRSVDLAAFAHDRTPFDVVMQDLNPPRDGGWVPLVGVMLAYQNTAAATMQVPGLRCETLAVPMVSARFDLRLEVVERGTPDAPGGLDLTATWAEQVASAEVAERLMTGLEQVLREALEDPGRRIDRLGRSDGVPLDRAPLPPLRGMAGRREDASRLAMVFSPFGQQWAGMGRRMIETEPVFAQAVEECGAALARHASWDVHEELARPAGSSRLEDVTIGQPLVFVVQVALARWLESRGVLPSVVVGHSLGELAASVVSGLLDLSDATRLLHHYTQQQGRIAGGGGAMLLVEASPDRVETVLAAGGFDAVVATVNGPRTTAVAGSRAALDRVRTHLEARRVACAWIRVDVAAHSPAVDAVLPALLEGTAGLVPRRPRVPMISSVTGVELDWRQADGAYFARNLRHRVQLSAAIATVLEQPTGALVEVSANPILGPALVQCVDEADVPTHVLGTMRRADTDDREGPEGLVRLLVP